LFWWIGQIVIGCCAIIFLCIGIDTLIFSYRLNHPHLFIMYFFSSSLMILISAVGLLWPAMNIYRRFRAATDEIQSKKDA
jgi:zinc transporter ZupT